MLVAGSGIAGMSAAISAMDKGAKVLVFGKKARTTEDAQLLTAASLP